MFLDGIFQASGTTTASIDTRVRTTIAASRRQNGAITGQLRATLSDIRIYNRALSLGEVHDLYVASRTGYVDQYKRRSFPVGVTPTPTESHPSNGLIRLKSPKQSQPSYKTGYAKSASESANPELWEGLDHAWVPNLGPTGSRLLDVRGEKDGNFAGTFNLGSGWTISENGPVARLDGNDYIDLGLVSWSDKFTASILFKPTDTLGAEVVIAKKTDAVAIKQSVQSYTNGTDFTARVYDSSGDYRGRTATGVITAGWQMVSFSWNNDSDELEIFRNGIRVDDTDSSSGGSWSGRQESSIPTTIGAQNIDNSPDALFVGDIGPMILHGRILAPAEIRTLHADPLAPFRQRRSIPFGVTISGAQAYTLTADTGAFNLTGNDATLTGPATAYTLTADTGAFTLTGNDVDPDADRQLTVSTGTFTLTGNDAILTKSSFAKFVVDTGTFTLTGNDTALKADHDVAASTGSYTLAGNASDLPADRQLVADTASVSLAGNDATLTYSAAEPTLIAATGEFTLTGGDATLTVSRKLTADTTSYTVAGNDTATKASRKFLATVASFDLDGPAVNLELSRRIALDTLTYNLTGVNTRLSYSEEDVSSIIQATSASIRCPQANGSISCADSDGTFVTP